MTKIKVSIKPIYQLLEGLILKFPTVRSRKEWSKSKNFMKRHYKIPTRKEINITIKEKNH